MGSRPRSATERLSRVANARATRMATSPARMLPTCVIIGAQKCGTTSLHHYLADHPEIGAPSRKEVHYFDSAWDRSNLWYRSFFPVRGRFAHTIESTPRYVFDPASPGRMRQVLPTAKLIVLFRDPVERTHSHYNHNRTLGRESRDFAQAIAEEESRLDGEAAGEPRDPATHGTWHTFAYVERSLYAPQIARWYEHFPPEQILILQSEDLFQDPGAVLARTQAWLGVRPHVPDSLRPLNARRYDQIDGAIATRLRKRFAADHAELEALTGIHFRWDRETV